MMAVQQHVAASRGFSGAAVKEVPGRCKPEKQQTPQQQLQPQPPQHDWPMVGEGVISHTTRLC
jgi:hypothetical protein